MCYDASSGLKKLIQYAKHRSEHPDYIASLERQLEKIVKEIKGHYCVSGFAHPKLLVFTNDKPMVPQAFNWGLIPAWIKDNKTAKTIANQTLNARVETIFEKPSFSQSAKHKRCLIYIDGFYEYHHFKGKTYPFRINAKDHAPLAIAGLWDEWIDKETGEILKTVTMVTTKANKVMAKIHNNEKLAEPRMPVILTKTEQDLWLANWDLKHNEQFFEALCKPLPDDELEYYTVKHIKGKTGVGDSPEAETAFNYPELAELF